MGISSSNGVSGSPRSGEGDMMKNDGEKKMDNIFFEGPGSNLILTGSPYIEIPSTSLAPSF